jgi:hypothetical protein
MDTISERHGHWVTHFWGVGLSLIIFAFFAQGEIAMANPVILGTIGLCAAFAVLMAHWAGLSPAGKGRWFSTAAIVCTLAAGGLITTEGWRVDRAIDANRGRCLTIERDILSANPRRSDGADLFQALGCRPQSADPVQFPPKTTKAPVDRNVRDIPNPKGMERPDGVAPSSHPLVGGSSAGRAA